MVWHFFSLKRLQEAGSNAQFWFELIGQLSPNRHSAGIAQAFNVIVTSALPLSPPPTRLFVYWLLSGGGAFGSSSTEQNAPQRSTARHVGGAHPWAEVRGWLARLA